MKEMHDCCAKLIKGLYISRTVSKITLAVSAVVSLLALIPTLLYAFVPLFREAVSLFLATSGNAFLDFLFNYTDGAFTVKTLLFIAVAVLLLSLLSLVLSGLMLKELRTTLGWAEFESCGGRKTNIMMLKDTLKEITR